MEQGDLHKRWKVVSKRLRNFHKCVVLPIGSLTAGLCRHRAILFKVKNYYVSSTFLLPSCKVYQTTLISCIGILVSMHGCMKWVALINVARSQFAPSWMHLCFLKKVVAD